MSGIFARFRARDLSLSDGDPVDQWDDISGNGKHLTGAGVTRPTFKVGVVNGKSAVRFSAHNLKAAAAADWKFLHDGTAHFGVIVAKIPSTHGDKVSVIMDTGALASADTGAMIAWDNRVSASRLECPLYWVAKGSVGNYVFQGRDVSYSCRKATGANERVHCFAFGRTVTRWGHWTDGILANAKIGPTINAPSASNPTGPLTIGDRVSGSFPAECDIVEMVFYNQYVNGPDRAAILAYYDAEYGSHSSMFGETEVAIASETYPAGPFGVCANNGRFIVGYRNATDHNSYDGTARYRISTDNGGTWGSALTLASSATWDYRECMPTKLSDGTLIMVVGRRPSDTSTTSLGIEIYRSTDHGDNWTLIATPDTGFTGAGRPAGNLLEMNDGTLLLPVYGVNTTGVDAALLRSSDGGETWGDRAVVTNLQDANNKYSEWSAVEVTPGVLEGWIRWDSGSSLYGFEWRKITSSDGGDTWSAPSTAQSGYGGMPWLVRRGNYIYGVTRSISETTSPQLPARLVSKKLGEDVWQKGYVGQATQVQKSIYGNVFFDNQGRLHMVYGQEQSSSAAGIYIARNAAG